MYRQKVGLGYSLSDVNQEDLAVIPEKPFEMLQLTQDPQAEKEKIRRRSKAIIVLLVCLLTSAPGQQPKPGGEQRKPEDADVVRVTTNLVQIDALVTDKNGRQITDLQPEEFEVFQDGRVQKVTNVSYISTRPPTTTTEAPTTKPGVVAKSTAPPVPPVSLRPDQVRRTIALIVDDLGLSFVSTAFVRRTLTKYINEQMQPGDLVAIIRTSAGAGALQQFTADKRQLLAAVDQVRWYPMGRGTIAAFAPIQPNAVAQAANTLGGSSGGDRAAADARQLSEKTESQQEDLGQLREEAFAVGTLGAVNYVVGGLEKLPGRKTVVLLSDGFKLFTGIKQGFRLQSNSDQPGINDRDAPSLTPNTGILEALRKLTDAANRASVVIYTMDTRGLETVSLTAEDNVSDKSADRIEEQLLDRRQEFVDTQAGLAYLARLTGGLAIQNENDLNRGLQRVLDDQAGYYLIGYRPDESTFDPKTGRADFHKIVVRVNRPDARVRSRSGFFGVADAESRGQRAASEQLADMLASPFGAAAHLRLTSLFGNDDRVGSLVSSVLFIDGHDLTFKEEPDGWREADIEVMAYTFGAYGEVVDSLSRTHKIRARGEVYESILREGLLYTVNVPIKKPGAYQLRIAVRDSGSKRVGTASQFVQVPDLSKERLALSGIFVSGLDTHKAKQPVDPDSLSQGPDDAGAAQASPALRRLHSGMEMFYAYYIYNAKVDVAKRPQLTTQMQLFHDGQLAYEGKVTPYDAVSEPDLRRLRSGGRIRLSPKAAAGEYVLQIIVTDNLAKEKQNSATQWIDFEIVN